RVRQSLELRARVRDDDELLAALPSLLPEVVEVRARLERRARLRRRDEQGAAQVERALQRANRARVRRVEHVERLLSEGPTQDLGRKARAAHAEQHDVVELVARRVCELDQLREALAHA